jgi:predicted RNA methylase
VSPSAREAATRPPESLAEVDWDRYDFIDLGASKGGSLEHCRKRLGARRGIGVDIDAAKVRTARDAGLDVVVGDATRLGVQDCVRFVSMLDFLEHLPDLAAVEAALRSAARAATDFLYVKHPSFEGGEYLESLGLCQYWWMWSGHTCHLTVADFHRIFARLGLTDYTIRYQEQVTASDHPSIIAATTPRNMQAHDPETHPPKPYVRFSRPVWRLQEILVALRPLDAAEWQALSGSHHR